jgi:hypothetical protein
LAVGHALRKLGYDLEYEKPFDDMTPDWLVSPRGAEPAFVVETFTANPPKSRTDDLKRLDHLLGRIHEILVGVVLNIHTNLPKTPKERESKKIKNEVEWWLTSGSPAVGEQLRLEGFTFEIVAEGASYDHVLTIGPSSPPGTFWVDANPLRKGVKEKVRKYKALGSTGIPLVVSVIADFYTGLNYEDFERAVLGSETGQSYRRHNDGLLTQVDSALSAVLWVSKEVGVWRATVIHNPRATNPLSSSTFKQPAR